MIESRLSEVDRSSLRDQVRRALHAGIITGEIEPSHLHTVGDFAKRLRVSATPVREALVDLANDGYVRVIRNRGFIVPELTAHDLDEIFELRLMLEVPTVSRIAGCLTPESIALCEIEVKRGAQAATAGDLSTFLDADRAFHHQLLAASGNVRLLRVVDRLRDQARLYGLADLAASGALSASADEHVELLAAIRRGDSNEAGRQMALHLNHTRGIWAGEPEREPGTSQ